jgi:hypothetical protein
MKKSGQVHTLTYGRPTQKWVGIRVFRFFQIFDMFKST